MPFPQSQATSVVSTPHPSPFRYPGGKSWLAPYVRQWLRSLERRVRFAEPFAGGANVGLTVALEDLAEHVTLVELDRDVATVWETVLNGHARHLADRILSFRMSNRSLKAVLARRCNSSLSRAFATIVKNRARRGGIIADGASLLKHGENGNGIKSRWYPETLKSRIEAISWNREKITFLCGDGLSLIRSHANDPGMAFFIDPPYTVAGRRLYTHSNVDHRKLFESAAEIQGSVLMTYDNSAVIRSLAREFRFEMKRVKMRTTHQHNLDLYFW
jgi:DNA adenine methylase